ncbi:MAG: VWA domain-containing protein [Myxococcota bacterium]|nr:VWA domain-containing protein [Myxococcota bacterium]
MLEWLEGISRAVRSRLPEVWDLPGLEDFGHFAEPLWLLLLVPVLAAVVVVARRRPRVLAWPALPEALAAGARSLDPARWLTLALRTAALIALVCVIARPLAEEREVRGRHEGLDVVLVLDASGSMRALDAQVDGEWQTRLTLAREVVARFASKRVAAGDRVGLVVFGDSAFTQSPLTSDGRLLEAALDRVEAGMAGEATALGEALALAVKRVAPGEALGDVPEGQPAPSEAPIAGRLIVLLTDGRSNAGSVPADVAASLAARARVRVHAVGIGTRGEVAVERNDGVRGVRFERHDLDLETLEFVAEASGGRSFHARSSADLVSVYEEIDALERVARPTPPRIGGAPLAEPFLAASFVFLLLEIVFARLLFRPLP